MRYITRDEKREYNKFKELINKFDRIMKSDYWEYLEEYDWEIKDLKEELLTNLMDLTFTMFEDKEVFIKLLPLQLSIYNINYDMVDNYRNKRSKIMTIEQSTNWDLLDYNKYSLSGKMYM